jgi:uncharacterized protein (DUF433 family)
MLFYILNWMSNEMSINEIIEDLSELDATQIKACR